MASIFWSNNLKNSGASFKTFVVKSKRKSLHIDIPKHRRISRHKSCYGKYLLYIHLLLKTLWWTDLSQLPAAFPVTLSLAHKTGGERKIASSGAEGLRGNHFPVTATGKTDSI